MKYHTDCHGCQTNCCNMSSWPTGELPGFVPMAPEDINRVAFGLNMSLEDFSELYLVDGGAYGPMLRVEENGDCAFYNPATGLCAVHETGKPGACSAFGSTTPCSFCPERSSEL